MKIFKKVNNNFICEECEKTFKDKICLSKHINKYHNIKKYYDKWLKNKNEEKCKICSKKTEFIGIKGYKNCCSKKCSNQYIQIQTEKGCIRIYGVKSTLQIKQFRDKGKQTKLEKYSNKNYTNRKKAKCTCLNKYSVDNPAKSEKIKEKIKQTKKNKYGDETYNNIEKMKDTKQNKYGYEYYTNREKCKQTKMEKYNDEYYTNRKKAEETMLQKYGVRYSAQNKEINEKGQKTRFEIHKYKNTNIWYQGSYELDFLEKYYDKYPDIERGPSIKYLFEGKNKVYHSDFYIPFLNLIVEIKNSYLFKIDKEKIKLKEKATINKGYNYIIITDKNYDEFNNLT